MKAKLYLSLFIILILLFPFSLSDKQDNINPDILSDSSVGYYQSTTCKISLLEFYSKNFAIRLTFTLIIIIMLMSNALERLLELIN